MTNKVLFELRPAIAGYSGIPQETRLVFSMFAQNPEYQTSGLLNGHDHFLNFQNSSSSATVRHAPIKQARSLIDLAGIDHRNSKMRRLKRSLYTSLDVQKHRLGLKSLEPIKKIPTDLYFDYVWRNYFSKTLSSDSIDALHSCDYYTCPSPWSYMHKLGLPRRGVSRYRTFQTDQHRVFIAQTPWPGIAQPTTKLIIRYHDAIPLTHPHTIHSANRHAASHYWALISNVKFGAHFICNSEYTRATLEALFPAYSENFSVIPCVVSNEYVGNDQFSDFDNGSPLSDIVLNHLESSTSPSFSSLRDESIFYQKHLKNDFSKYLLVIGTIEPRKNHSVLIEAWRLLRDTCAPDLKLVIVGVPGWLCDDVLRQMRPWQKAGKIFNISGVPISSLRRLIQGAECVVCPSRAEGFDIPGVETQLCRGRLVASDIQVHREIFGPDVTYFDAYSAKDAASKIYNVIQNKNTDHMQRMLDSCFQHSQQYLPGPIAVKWFKLLNNYF